MIKPVINNTKPDFKALRKQDIEYILNTEVFRSVANLPLKEALSHYKELVAETFCGAEWVQCEACEAFCRELVSKAAKEELEWLENEWREKRHPRYICYGDYESWVKTCYQVMKEMR